MTISLFNPMQPSSRSRQFPHLWAPAVFHLRRQLVTRWAPRKTMHRLVESKSLMCIENIWELPDPHKVPNSWGYMLFGTFIFTFRNVPSFFVNALGIMEGFLKSVPKAHGWNWSRSNGLPKSAAKSFKEVWFVAVVPKRSPEIPGDQMPSWFFKSFTFDCVWCSSMSFQSRFDLVQCNRFLRIQDLRRDFFLWTNTIADGNTMEYPTAKIHIRSLCFEIIFYSESTWWCLKTRSGEVPQCIFRHVISQHVAVASLSCHVVPIRRSLFSREGHGLYRAAD